MTATRGFLAADVFLYFYSRQNPLKHTQARRLMQEPSREQDLLLSTQLVESFITPDLAG